MSRNTRPWLIPQVVLGAVVTLLVTGCSERSVLESGQMLPQKSTVQVWFVKAEGDNLKLVAVERPMATGDKLKQAVSELLRGPTYEEMQHGLNSEIPKGTILLGVKANGDDVDLDLSQRFASGGGSDSLSTRLDQLSKTVASAAGAKKVYLSVEGERLSAAAGEGLEIKQPLN